MNKFEQELRQAKENSIRAQEDAKLRRARQEREKREQLEAKQARKKAELEEAARPLKPMVDSLMTGLGTATWGAGNFDLEFTITATAAQWRVGHTEYEIPRTVWGFWRRRKITGRGINPKLGFEIDIAGAFFTERFFALELQSGETGKYFFKAPLGSNTSQVNFTHNTSERALKSLLKKQFLAGPYTKIRSVPHTS